MKDIILTKKDYKSIVKVLLEAKTEKAKDNIFFNGEADYLAKNPNFYNELLSINKNKELETILKRLEPIAKRKIEGWIWCKDICHELEGAKRFGDWRSFHLDHFPKMDKIRKDFEFVKSTTPKVLEEKVISKVKQLKQEIDEKNKNYDPTSWQDFIGSNLSDDTKRKLDPKRDSFLHSYLLNSLIIKMLESYFLTSSEKYKNLVSRTKKKKEVTFLTLFRMNEERKDKFFALLNGQHFEALDAANEWGYNGRKSSIVACFQALSDLDFIRYKSKAELVRIIETEISFEGSESLFYQSHSSSDYENFEKKFREYLT